MTKELQIASNNNLIDWKCEKQLKVLKDIYAKKATPEEFSIFVNLGKATGLNPFLKEMWLLKYGSEAASIFIARDGYRKSAQNNSNYDYHLADAVYSKDNFRVINGEVSHEYSVMDRGVLVGAYCIVKRKSSTKPVFVYVELKEYDKKQSIWKEKPATMIKKCAEAQCLRMAFQELFANTYHEDEYTPIDNSIEARSQRASSNVGQLIEGKAVQVATIEEVVSYIEKSEDETSLTFASEMAKSLISSIEKNIARDAYKKKKEELVRNNNKTEKTDQETGEVTILNESEKIKNKLINARSLDELQLAADLIESSGEDRKDELMEIYTSRIDEFKE